MMTITVPRLKRWACLLLLALCLFFLVRAALDPYDNRIAEGVTVGGLDLGGKTRWEAYRTLKEATIPNLELRLPEETVTLSPAPSLRCWSAVRAAYRVGRKGSSGHALGLLPHLRLKEKSIQTMLEEYAARTDTDCTPSRYVLIGDVPDLNIAENPAEEGQVLELTLGLPTARFDREDAFRRILAVYDAAFDPETVFTLDDFKVDILEEPEAPDLAAIYEDVSIPPADDSLDMETYDYIPGAWGYHFDLAQAEQMAAAGDWGETLSIRMKYQKPDIYGDQVYFRDVLGHCETQHTQDENRNNNLRKAAEAMDGLILQPGEIFSYNDALGPRTKENGYLQAGAYSGWELVLSYGGGICQGSSTIYGAVLEADLEVVQRRNHGYMVSYVEPGLDATVNWGGPDFQFRNSSHFPIKIAAEVSDGYVKVTILGTEERDYYVVMESEANWGSGAVYAKSYKCKYDRETGALLSRELEARSNYAI